MWQVVWLDLHSDLNTTNSDISQMIARTICEWNNMLLKWMPIVLKVLFQSNCMPTQIVI